MCLTRYNLFVNAVVVLVHEMFDFTSTMEVGFRQDVKYLVCVLSVHREFIEQMCQKFEPVGSGPSFQNYHKKYVTNKLIVAES